MDEAMLASEWLEPDGRGGYASGTVGGARARAYHALLLTATVPPTARMALVNGIEAFVESPSERIALSSQRYQDGTVYPDGASRIESFTPNPWPSWRYLLPDGAAILQEILVNRDTCETVLRWRIEHVGRSDWRLTVRPLLSGRDHGAVQRKNNVLDFAAHEVGGTVTWRPYPGVPAVTALSNGTYRHEPEWFEHFLYETERDRGLPDEEDLASPGTFSFQLTASTPALLVLRAGDSTATRVIPYAEALILAERQRRNRLGQMGSAAACYLVDRGPGRTVIAGFPWFTDWGRDSFIALRGLAIGQGWFGQAQQVLLAWAALVDRGMLPNRFPDSGGAAEFNAVDASLWFIVAVADFLDAAKPGQAVTKPLADAVLAILSGYAQGTRYGIRADADGLLAAGEPGVQLTWMDAITDGHVITPRIGKPVEVQALWINALRVSRRWSKDFNALEEKARASFQERFIRPDGTLYDVVDADHEPGKTDAALRPNQIFAVGGLPLPILEGEAAAKVVAAVEAKLVTPLGLRTLSPDDPAYCPRYAGDLTQRDAAYHQGTAWPWLMGPFVQAWLRVHGDGEAERAEAKRRFLDPLEAHLHEGGLGHIAEVVDGDAPHTPGGCPFQAWSFGEYLRIKSMLRA